MKMHVWYAGIKIEVAPTVELRTIYAHLEEVIKSELSTRVGYRVSDPISESVTIQGDDWQFTVDR